MGQTKETDDYKLGAALASRPPSPHPFPLFTLCGQKISFRHNLLES